MWVPNHGLREGDLHLLVSDLEAHAQGRAIAVIQIGKAMHKN